MTASRDRGVSVYVLVDALGWEILRGRPFLDDVLTDRHRVTTILGYSSGAIPSLLTGQPPSGHGHWNLFYRSPETSPFRWVGPLRRLPRGLREGRVLRRAVKEVSRRVSGYTGYFAMYNLPLDRVRFFDICETADIYQPGGLAPARSLFDVLRDDRVPYECYTYHRYTDAQTARLVPQRLRESDCRVFFIYLSELDAYLHARVSDPAVVTARLHWYEDALRTIHRAARERWGQVRLYVFSDHGMTPISGTRDLIPEVERLGLSIPGDYLPVYDSTMARFWVFSDRAERRLQDLLSARPDGRLLPEAELKALGIHFDDGRYGHLVFLMNSGLLICPSDMGRVRFDGMHGFHPDEPESYAVLLSTETIDQPLRDITSIHDVVVADVRRHHLP